MSLLGLGDYDSAEGTPAGAGDSPAEEAAAPAAASSLQLSIVDYDNDPDDKPEDTSNVLGVSLDDDVMQGGSAKRVGLGGVQISVTKKPAAKSSSGSGEAEGGAPPEQDAAAAPAADFVIPGSPPGEVDSKLADKFRPLVAKTREGYSVNEHIRNAKSFRNPDILEKLVNYFDVRECGTNYPPSLYDPGELTREEHYDRLEEARRKWEERQARKQGEKVAFSSGGVLDVAVPKANPPTAPTLPSAATAAAAAAGAAALANKPRKSKWGERE